MVWTTPIFEDPEERRHKKIIACAFVFRLIRLDCLWKWHYISRHKHKREIRIDLIWDLQYTYYFRCRSRHDPICVLTCPSVAIGSDLDDTLHHVKCTLLRLIWLEDSDGLHLGYCLQKIIHIAMQLIHIACNSKISVISFHVCMYTIPAWNYCVALITCHK